MYNDFFYDEGYDLTNEEIQYRVIVVVLSMTLNCSERI